MTIRSLMEPWDREFEHLLTPPRTLPELKLISLKGKGVADYPSEYPPGPGPAEENIHMKVARESWFSRKVHDALTALLGRGWMNADNTEDPAEDENEQDPDTASRFCHDIPGAGIIEPDYDGKAPAMIRFHRAEDAERLPEILNCIRQIWAHFPMNRSALILVDLDPEWVREPDYWKSSLRRKWEEYQEDAEYFDRERQKKRDYEERLLRMKMAEESGVVINPEDFAPDPGTHGIWQSETELRRIDK